MTVKEIDRHLSFLRKKYLIKSFFRKAKRIVADFIPLSEIPSGHITFRTKSREESPSLTFTPKTFLKKSSSLTVQLSPVEIYGLQNVYVTPDSTYFLSTDLQSLYYEAVEGFSSDFTLLYNSRNLLFHGHQLAKVNNLPKEKRNAEAIFLGGTFSFNYFHFLIEILPKFQFLSRVPHKNAVLVAPEAIKNNSNLRTLLTFFAGDQRVQYLNPDTYYQFEKVWHITYPCVTVPNIGEGEHYLARFTKFSKESIGYVRNVCLDSFRISEVRITQVSRIFLARRSEFRKYNEAELLEIAVKYGFEAVYLEDLNIHEQMFLMQNADYIIGPSGAAWTNIIFAQEGRTKGLVWLGNVWKDFSAFSTLAAYAGFDLYHFRFDHEEATFHSDYVLNPTDFINQLTQLLKT
jgi:hypothetical protein